MDRLELQRQAQDFYHRHTAYLLETHPIVLEMTKLKAVFTSPRVVIGNFALHEEWISPEAAALYHNYEQLLWAIQDRYMQTVRE